MAIYFVLKYDNRHPCACKFQRIQRWFWWSYL